MTNIGYVSVCIWVSYCHEIARKDRAEWIENEELGRQNNVVTLSRN